MRNKFLPDNFLVALATLAAISSPSFGAGEGSLLKELGLKKGQHYFSARASLLKNGWKIDASYADTTDSNQKPPYGFKEVVCGNGWQAVCSARFLRNDNKIMLTMQPKQDLLIDGAWNDKP